MSFIQALTCEQPGLFKYIEIPEPKSVKGYSIIRIRRIGICGTDLHAYKGTQPYFNYPRILGHEIAAEYVAGDSVKLKAGDLCTAMPYISCGKCRACLQKKTNCCLHLKVCGVHTDGAMAEYYSIPSELLVPADGLDLDELGLLEPLAVAAHGINRAGPMQGDPVLIMGAGPIGLGLVIMAKAAGAEVWLMDFNESRLNFATKQFGITHTLQPEALEWMETYRSVHGEDLFPLVIDATGSLKAIESGIQYLGHGGQYILVGLQKRPFSFSHPEFHKRETTLKSSRNATLSDFHQVKQSILAGTIEVAPLITHRIPFSQVIDRFESLYVTQNQVIKAMIEF
ncbi:MAG: zinc-binding alcohol dehydrogenase family protein [Saprospiraceae bacterium]|nr:zinc-binding alcohol dehydrogenase family protein [Saprospiraceae bacterium]